MAAVGLSCGLPPDADDEGTREQELGSTYYVAPNGSSSGSGTKASPWSLSAALSSGTIRAGDTIRLRGGTYGSGGSTVFTCSRMGSSGSPITWTNEPGEVAKINGQLRITGNWNVFQANIHNGGGLHVTNTSSSRYGVGQKDAVQVTGKDNKLRGMWVYNGRGHGITDQKESERTEINGCVLYGNGRWDEQNGRWEGSAIYGQNKKNVGTKLYKNNISFASSSTLMKIVSTGDGSVAYSFNGTFDGNILFSQGLDRIHVVYGIYEPATNIKFNNNATYTHYADTQNLDWGYYGTSTEQRDITVSNNIMHGSDVVSDRWGSPFRFFKWRTINFTNNFVVGFHGLAMVEASSHTYNFSGNRYHYTYSKPFGFYSSSQSLISELSFDQWKARGMDTSGSTHQTSLPSGVTSRIYPLDFDPGIAYLVIYNWDDASSVNVDLSSWLSPGASYRSWDAQNIHQAQRLERVWSGTPQAFAAPDTSGGFVSIAQGSDTPSGFSRKFTHTPRRFQVYILEKTGTSSGGTPPPTTSPPSTTGQVSAPIADFHDDGQWRSDGTNYGFSNWYAAAGQRTGVRFNSWLRFALAVPRGARIVDATLTVTAKTTQATGVSALSRIFAQAADNPSFPASAAAADALSKTAASAVFNPGAGAGWTTGQAYRVPGLAAVVQEVVNRGGWNSGNHIQLLVLGDPSATGIFFIGANDGNGTGPTAVLNVSYE